VAKQIGLILDTCDSLLDRRDRALIVLGFAAARRSELVALESATWRSTTRAWTSDPPVEGRPGGRTTLPVLHGAHLFPVAAVRDWIEASGITTGPLFRQVSRAGV
jgi:hypothetical protein